MRKLTAGLLIVVMIFSLIPFEVFANYQSHVKNLIPTYIPTTNGNYKINLSWTNPTRWSTVTDVDAEDGDEYHTPEDYKAQMLNATASESTYQELISSKSGSSDSSCLVEESLTDGSLYEFRVMPYHYHTYKTGTSISKKEAPYAGNAYERVLFMTDIDVEATGSGNKMTVTWDNPTYKGYDVFSGYRIYYQRGGKDVTAFNTYRDVNINDDDLVRTNDTTRVGVQRLTYDIYDDTFVQGEVYAIKVEPLYLGYEVRNLSSGTSYTSVSINNTTYKLCFRYINDKEYRTNDADIAVPLEVYEDGKNFLKLHWWGISNTSGDIERIELYSGDAEDNIGTKIGTIYTPQAIYVNNWQIERPSSTTYYQVRIYISDKKTPIYSTIAVYDPNIVTITPNIPNIYTEVGGDGLSLDVYWDTFTRYPYNSNEEAFVRDDGTYIDTNVKYDVWISDKLENLSDSYMPKIIDGITAIDLTMTEYDGVDIPVYSYNFNQYYTVTSSGEYQLKEMTKNKTYYIKLVATKPVTDGNDLSCEPAYGSQYIPTDEDISNPQTLSKPPLRILTDSDGKQMITTDTISIGWNTKWFEVYDDATDQWYSKAKISNGTLSFTDTDSDDVMDFSIYSDLDYFKSRLIANGLSEDTVEELAIRQIDLTDSSIKYEMLVKKYDAVNQDGGYDWYISKLLKDDSDEWQTISPSISGIEAQYDVTGLESNTAYVIILRPYRILDDGTKDAYPTYVLGTTAISDTKLDITPTVPLLSEVDHDDHSFEIKWEEHIPNLDYELRISETNLSDPSSASIKIGIDDIKKYGLEKTENGKLYMYYTVDNLFPETGYYVWIRSIAQNDGTEITSVWSNPVYIETSPLENPQPPDGLGLAASEHMKIYNRANSVNYLSADYNYLVVEWSKDYDDTSYTSSQGLSGTGWEALGNDQITNDYMVKFNDLIANTEYYIRAKTVLIVENGGTGSSDSPVGGGAKRTFAYVVQLSLTKDFKDVVEAIVPISDIPEETATASKIYVGESDWCSYIRLYTEPNENEYDGDKNPDLYPLPDDDFEIVYDYGTMDLKYRFRSDKEDEDGNDDNLVDQRFISRLIQNHTFTFPIDLTSYDSQTIKTRTVEMPYSIVSALDERKINLEITANNITFTLSPEFIKTAEVKNLSGLGYGSTVTVKIEEKPSDSPELKYNQTYLSIPQKISVQIKTPSLTYNLANPANCMNVAIKLNSRSASLDSNVDSYYDSDATSEWSRITGTFDNASGTVNVYTARFGTFCAIANAAPVPVGNADTSNISSLASRINIEDTANYNPQSAVSSVQFNNLVSAVALGKKDVKLNKALTTEEYTALSKKNMLTDGSVISREQGIDILVKLYEAKTKQKFEPYSDISSTPYSDIAQASNYYKANLIKAGDLGFYNNTSGARPKDIMSLDELFYMMNIVLQDCNY